MIKKFLIISILAFSIVVVAGITTQACIDSYCYKKSWSLRYEAQTNTYYHDDEEVGLNFAKHCRYYTVKGARIGKNKFELKADIQVYWTAASESCPKILTVKRAYATK